MYQDTGMDTEIGTGMGTGGSMMNSNVISSGPAPFEAGVMQGVPVQPQEQKKKSSRKWVVLGSIMAAVIAVVIVLLVVMTNRGKAMLIVQVTPASAVVEIDGKKYQNGTYEINPVKSARVVVYKEGFATQVFRFDAEVGETVAVATFLTGENDDLSYYRDNYDDLYLLWEYFCTYTDTGEKWYLAETLKVDPEIDASSLEGEDKLLYDFLVGE